MKVETKRCRHGTFTYPVNDKWIGKSLKTYGEYSELEFAALANLIMPGQVVVEVGANIGALSVPIAKHLGKDGRLYLFEPQPEAFDLLSRNLSQNDIQCDVSIKRAAVGDRVGEVGLQDVDYDAELFCIGGVGVGSGARTVEMIRLDDLNLQRLDFLKADVEGYEAQVLEGARETIKRCRPRLYVESDRPEKRAELLEIIDSMGYLVFEHKPPLFNEGNWEKNDKNVFWPFVSINLFCVPIESGITAVTGMDQVWAPRVDREEDRLLAHYPPTGKTVCVLREAAIGDAIQVSSVTRALKKDGFHVTLVTWPQAADVLRHEPSIDKILPISVDFGPWERLSFVMDVYRERFSKVVVLSGVVEHTLVLSPNKTAHHDWPHAARHRLCNHNYVELMHEVAETKYELGQRFVPADGEINRAKEFRRSMRKLCVLAPVGTGVNKKWPGASAFVSLLLQKMPEMHIAVVGKESLSYEAHPRLHMLGMSWPIRDALSLAKQADVVVGQDTGVLNAVALESNLKVVLLSQSSVENITRDWINTVSMEPRQAECFPCHRLHPTFSNCFEKAGYALCMHMHSPLAVCEIVRARLQAAA